MTDPIPDQVTPKKILLATDLSARSDRALERAIMIAQHHGAHLLVVHAFEEFDESTLTYAPRAVPSWRKPPDALALMKQRIAQSVRADLGDAVEKATFVIEAGDPAQIIEQVATSERADLVITGVAREGLFASRPVVLGRTVEHLLRRLSLPILVVRNRARSAYQHVVVATDFSAPSASALQVALRFFPARPVYLLHAAEAPYPLLASDPDRHTENFRDARADELRDFLAAIYLPAGDLQRVVPLVEPGAPQQLIREYVQTHAADLVVLGTHGRGAVLEALLGSTVKSILATVPCDALVVRGPRR